MKKTEEVVKKKDENYISEKVNKKLNRITPS